jgi:septum site-determining protein MinD
MERGRTIAVYSGAGGAGKTLIAVNLAVSLHQQDAGRILLIDGSHPLPGEAADAIGVGRANTKTLADMEPVLERFTPELFASYLSTAPAGPSVIALAGDVLAARAVGPELLERLLELSARSFDLVVVDLAPGVGPLTADILEHSDTICLVADPSPAGLARGRASLEYLDSIQTPHEAIVVCMNRVPDGMDVAERAKETIGLPAAAAIPLDGEAAVTTFARGTPISHAQPRHGIARAIDRLARQVAARGLRKVNTAGAAPAGVSVKGQEEEAIRELKLKIHRRLVEEISLRKSDLAYLRDPAKLTEMRRRAESKVQDLLEQEGADIHSREIRRRIVKDVLDEALGLGPLEDLLADPAITEIMVNRHDQIFVERNGKLQLTDTRFLNTEQLRGMIERIVAPLGRRIDEKVPMVDARLRDGSRVNAIIPPLALRGPAVTIRKFSKRLLSVEDLIRYGSLTEQMATFLKAAVHVRQNIVISGGTGSGKTTLLNVLASFIPHDDRIITIEDSAELQLPQEHVVALESRPANIEGEGAISIRDLVRNALRMRPDRIVVGECRGGEALDMLQAMNTGHDGSLTTVHANTPRDALSRLETMSLMAGLELPSRAIRDQIASAVNFVIQQSRLQDGTRRITHITEVSGQENGTFVTANVFEFRQTGLAPDGKIFGQFVPTGYVPAFVETLARRGITLPREIFLHQTA